MAEGIKTNIRSNAEGPRRAQGDSGSVEQHSLREQIEADRYLTSRDATAGPMRGLRFSRLVPPGSV